MKKKTNIRTIIRKIVREEVAMAIGEVVNELKQPSLSSKPQRKIVEKKQYSSNSVLNDVLNETAADDWETLGGGKFTTERMNELVGGQYGDMMNSNSNTSVTVDGQTADFLQKDYREVLKKADEKQKQKYGK
tara:strand:+ start:3064 stop:3459 length:396 start_codon:yes stop_codon:yes gene_type:complete